MRLSPGRRAVRTALVLPAVVALTVTGAGCSTTVSGTAVIAEPKVAAIAYPSLKGDFLLTVDSDGPFTLQAYFSGKPAGPAKPVELKGRDVDMSRDPIKVAPDKKKGKDDDDEKKSE